MTNTLKLSDYELGYLTAFSHQSYEDWCDTNREPEVICATDTNILDYEISGLEIEMEDVEEDDDA